MGARRTSIESLPCCINAHIYAITHVSGPSSRCVSICLSPLLPFHLIFEMDTWCSCANHVDSTHTQQTDLQGPQEGYCVNFLPT